MDENTAVLLLCNATMATFITGHYSKDNEEKYKVYLEHLLVNELINDGVAIAIPKEAFFEWVENNGVFYTKEDLEGMNDDSGNDREDQGLCQDG